MMNDKHNIGFISMTDESFQELIAAYLRPVTRKLLFEK